MKTKIIQNKTNKIIYPGGVAIRPGDSRPVPAHLLPEGEVVSFSLDAFFALSAKEITKKIPSLADENIYPVFKAELSDKNRSTVLEAIEKEAVERDIDLDFLSFKDELTILTDDQIQTYLLEESTTDEQKTLLEAELESRSGANDGSAE